MQPWSRDPSQLWGSQPCPRAQSPVPGSPWHPAPEAPSPCTPISTGTPITIPVLPGSTLESRGNLYTHRDLGLLNTGVGKGPCKARLFQPQDTSLSQHCVLQQWLCQAPGAGHKSIPLPWEKAAEAPTALPSWLNFPVSNWHALNWTGMQFGSTDPAQNQGVQRDH